MLWNWQSGMWLHFGGTLTLKSDDGRGAGAAAAGPWYMNAPGQDGGGRGYNVPGTCTPGQDIGGRSVHVGKNYGRWTHGTCGQELRNCPLLMLLLVGDV